jgi:hypothetical protein
VIEAETIQSEDDTVVLRIRHFSANLALAREEKDGAMLFKAAACDAGSVQFDGQGPQDGEHISYRRAGDTLSFTGDFIHQGKPLKVEVSFKRAGD